MQGFVASVLFCCPFVAGSRYVVRVSRCEGRPLKYAIGWLVSQALYWLGHFVSLTFSNRHAIAYPAYKWLMVWSSNVDGWAGSGLWKRGEDVPWRHDQ